MLLVLLAFLSYPIYTPAPSTVVSVDVITSMSLPNAETIPEVELRDTAVANAVRAYVKHLRESNNTASYVLCLRQEGHNVDKKEQYYSVGHTHMLNDVLEHVPYAYTSINGEIVLLYAPNEMSIIYGDGEGFMPSETAVRYSKPYMDSLKALLNPKNLKYIDVKNTEKYKRNPNLRLITGFQISGPWKVTTYKDGTHKVSYDQ